MTRSTIRRVAVGLVLGSTGLAASLAAGQPAEGQDASCSRIVALAPSAAELVFALGLGDRVVGVGDYVRWPPEARELPRLGGLADPHREQIVALAPDLAVLLPSEAELGRQLRALGIDTLEIPSETVEDVERAARRIDERCPAADEGWIAGFRRALAPRPRTATDVPDVLLVIDRAPGDLSQALAAGPGTFYDELLARLGARNVVHDARIAYPRISLEQVLARDPDVIVELRVEAPSPAARARLLADWARLGNLRAVETGAVRIVAGDHVLVPGPRLPLLYAALARALGS
jgi:iron complex transport system substrate-binding protein